MALSTVRLAEWYPWVCAALLATGCRSDVDTDGLEKTCDEASDCIVVAVGDTCDGSCSFDAIHEAAFDDYQTRLATPCATNPLQYLGEAPFCDEQEALCVGGTCAASVKPQRCERDGTVVINGGDDTSELVGLEIIEGDLCVSAASDEDLQVLATVSAIEHDVFIGSGPALENLDGLRNVARIGGALHVETAEAGSALTRLGLGELREVGALRVSTPTVTSVADLESLTRIDRELSITAPLVSLAGLESITQLEALTISGTDIEDVEGLRGLTRINGPLFVRGNDALASLDGFAALDFVREDPEIFLNASLPQSDVDELARRLGHPCEVCGGNASPQGCAASAGDAPFALLAALLPVRRALRRRA